MAGPLGPTIFGPCRGVDFYEEGVCAYGPFYEQFYLSVDEIPPFYQQEHVVAAGFSILDGLKSL